MKPTLLSLCALLAVTFLQAQPYMNQEHTRHRFAQLTLGGSLRANPLEGYHDKNQSLEPTFFIGGTHFWGHTEFYVEIPLGSTQAYSRGVETGAKLLPWAPAEKKLRPYVSTAFTVTELKLGEGSLREDLRFPFGLGLLYMRNGWMFDASWSWMPAQNIDYYTSQSQYASLALPGQSFSIGIRKMLETTLSAEKSWQSGKAAEVTEKLAEQGRLDGFTLAAGVSSVWFTQASGFNQEEYPFLSDQVSMAAFADLGLGYYFHKTDWQLNLAYRRYRFINAAFDFEQEVSRASTGLEAYKFLRDYHGFVPYLGGIVSYEQLGYEDPNWTHSQNGWNAGITFGWDIRPNRLGVFTLRTNLRYYPSMSLQMDGKPKFNLNQIEFNFIQLVLYPQRIFGFI